MLKKKSFTLIATAIIIAVIGGVRAYAIGHSPAFEGYTINEEDRRAEITKAVSSELNKILPLTNEAYKNTIIHLLMMVIMRESQKKTKLMLIL